MPPSSLTTERVDERRLTFVGHLEELRRRLLISVATLGVTTMASFASVERFIVWLKRPAGEALPKLAVFSPTEALLAYLTVALIAGLLLALPVILYQAWAFIRPGLSPTERRYGVALLIWGSGLFLVGIAFAYGILLPLSLKFLFSVGREYLIPMISLNRYLSFVTMVMLSCGVVFELPVAVFLLTKLGWLTPALLWRQWRYAILLMAIAAAILTPTPDAATMVLVMIPMVVLYQLSIAVCWFAASRTSSKTP